MCDRCALLEEELTQLRKAMGITTRPRYGLTEGEWQIIGPLFHRYDTGGEPVISHDQILVNYRPRDHASELANPGTIKTMISHARRKLKPHGWEIQPIWGRGYELVRAPESKKAA